jgi:DNA polymerase elongation subunit (family B)
MNFSDNYNNFANKLIDVSKYSLEELTQLLHEAKDIQKQYENLQLIVKRNANSLYGVSASIYFSLHDVDIAEDITMTGKHFAVIVDRAINKFFVNWDEKELNIIREFYPKTKLLKKFTEYVPDTKNDLCVYGDTDSRYIDLERIYALIIDENGNQMKLPQLDEELANFGCFLVSKFINQIIKDTIKIDCEYRNGTQGHLIMNHEITTRKSVFQKKKKYAYVTIWKDGKLLKKPKLNYKGLDIKRGSSSPRIKKILGILLDKFMLEGYDVNMLRQECLKLIQYIKQRKEKDLVYQITSVSGLDDIIKKPNSNIYSCDKNHIQMQIALSWYNFIEENKLQSEYKPPFQGQKMNFYYCNPDSKYKVIGVPDDVNINNVKGLPEPDWNRMINISLIKPLLRLILEINKITDKDIENFLLGIKTWNFGTIATE